MDICAKRERLHGKMEVGDILRITKGKHKGKKVKLLKKGDIQNQFYDRGKYEYHSYFCVSVETLDGYKFVTSCNNIGRTRAKIN